MQLNKIELQHFDTLLSLPDNDLWDMITSKKKGGRYKTAAGVTTFTDKLIQSLMVVQ